MKHTFIMGIVALTLASFTTQAQQWGDPPVKILPAAQKGTFKILYASEIDDDVEVKFFSGTGVITIDKIAGEFPKGVLKRYDLNQVNEKRFWVEVTSPKMTVTYRLQVTREGKFEPVLEKATFNHVMVASNH
jgi:hypothetical protein